MKESPDNDPSIGDISRSGARNFTAAKPSDVQPVSDNPKEESASRFLSVPDETVEDSTNIVTPDISGTSSQTQKPESTLLELLPMDMLIRLEQQNEETQNVAEQFTQLIKNRDIEGFRKLLERLLTEGTPLQVLVVFHVIAIKGNTLLHWLSTVHSKELDQELKHMLEAFGAYNEQPEGSFSRSLWEIRREIALKKLNRNSLWKLESVVDLDDFKPAVLLRNERIQNYYRVLKRELMTPGKTRFFIAITRGNTKTEEDLFGLLKSINKVLPFDEEFIEETKQFVTLLTPPLYIKNQQGLSPLQVALQTSKTKKDNTVAILSQAETIMGIDTNTDSSLNSKRKLLWKRIGIGAAVTAIGATCAYMFY